MILRGFLAIWFLSFSVEIASQSMNTVMRANWDDEGQTYNDVWGYADESGREYAILGSRDHTYFIDVTDPDNPVEVGKISSGEIRCVWRDYKTYGHYAYGVADRCRNGLQIFDLSNLPDTVTMVYDDDIFFDDVHNLFIDTVSGRLYACGYTRGGKDIVVLDLTEDPENPCHLADLDLDYGYVHDLYVRNDTGYCSHGNTGMAIYDWTNLDTFAIGFINSYTGKGYNHSNWVSANDVMVLADETKTSPVKLFQLTKSGGTEILFEEKSIFKSTLLAPTDSNSIAHNPYILNDKFVITSYYHDGLQIHKIDSIESPFRAGYYDTKPENTDYFGMSGAWGAYPYLPSGNLLASDISHGLFIITPQFPLSDCNQGVFVQGQYDHHWTFVSQDTFTTDAIYSANSQINFVAPNEIEFLPGFSVESGSVLSAIIEDRCVTASSLSQDRPTKPNRKN